MYYYERPRTGCVQRVVLIVAGCAAVLLGFAYFSTHPDFFASIFQMATSDEPVTVALWSTPTPQESRTSIKFSDLPTVSPSQLTQQAVAQRTATVQPDYRPDVVTTYTKPAGIAFHDVLLYGAVVLVLGVFVVVFCKTMFSPLSAKRRRR